MLPQTGICSANRAPAEVGGTVAWLAADWAGYGYGLGSWAPQRGLGRRSPAAASCYSSFFLAVGVLGGAALAGPRRLRRADAARSARALPGGLLMGPGGSIAHGCNIGHGLTGVPLLSLGSLLATTAMAAGALLTWRLVVSRSARLRGTETPARRRLVAGEARSASWCLSPANRWSSSTTVPASGR